ncbi:DUF2637 domain-containing protein [Sinomonas sp. ASV486]|uniref:DUF2637 domain-containing protein n=1 Tax=Sinomonas sp. ASV486 TaxID=3051170 RepID=UPI0027DC1D4C|nr:DUF2637 domain-containing protein [Sinomonas sp. ASV486]MDQ4489370.1 DUF2637 domain-containing protein [Sinomonas sp. ASV486]
MKHKPISRPIVATGIASTVVIGSGAFVLSFSALTDLAVRAGINPEIGWMWPLIVDGMIVAATVAIVALAGREGKEQFYPWILLFFGAVVSTAANSIHAILAVKASNGNVPIAVSALVAAMPPVVLLAITHLTVLLVQYARNSAEIQAALAAAEEMERAASAADAVPAPAPAADAPVAPALTANAAAGGVDVVETVLAETVLADSVRAETAAADASPAAPVVKPAARSSRRTGDTGQIAAVSAADASAEKPKAAPKRKPRKTTTATQPVVPAAPAAKPAAARTAPKAPASARQLMPELGTVTAVNPILRGSVAADVKPAAEGESKTASASSAGTAATPAVASTLTVASAPASSAATPAPEAAPEVAAEEAAKELVSSPA